MVTSWRKALGIVKDQTSIGLAKMVSSRLSGLDVAIVKATSHDDTAVDEIHTKEVLLFTSVSSYHREACLRALRERIEKTSSWVVAIKVLVLTHRLLREGDPAFQEDIMRWIRKLNLMIDIPCVVNESYTLTSGEYYAAFIRKYAEYLDSRLGCIVLLASTPSNEVAEDKYVCRYGDTIYETSTGSSLKIDFNDRNQAVDFPYRKYTTYTIKDTKRPELLLIDRLSDLQKMLEHLLACLSMRGAKNVHPLIQFSLRMIIQDSFQIYSNLCEGISTLLNVYFDMNLEDCLRTVEILRRFAFQCDSLSSFYIGQGVSLPSEYPPFPKMSQDYIDTLETFLIDRSMSSFRSVQRPIDGSENNHKSPVVMRDGNLANNHRRKAYLKQQSLPNLKDLRDDETYSEVTKPSVSSSLTRANAMRRTRSTDFYTKPGQIKVNRPLITSLETTRAGISSWELSVPSKNRGLTSVHETSPLADSFDHFNHFETVYNNAIRSNQTSVTEHPGLDSAIARAISNEDKHLDEKYTQKIFRLIAFSHGHTIYCLQELTKRMRKTRNWTVAMKVLLLIHRLLREGNPDFQESMRWTSRRGLNVPTNLVDEPDSSSGDYAAFSQTYGAYLHARLDCVVFAYALDIVQSRDNDNGSQYTRFSPSKRTPSFSNRSYESELMQTYTKQPIPVKELEQDKLNLLLQNLQDMIDQVLACRPTDAAKNHPLVQASLHIIIQDSFQIYSNLCDGIEALMSASFLFQLEERSRMYEVLLRFAEQCDSLLCFYKGMDILSISSENPPFRKVTQIYLDTLEVFLKYHSSSSCPESQQILQESKRKTSDGLHPETGEELTTDNIMPFEVKGLAVAQPPETVHEISSKLEEPPHLTDAEDWTFCETMRDNQMALDFFASSCESQITFNGAAFARDSELESSQENIQNLHSSSDEENVELSCNWEPVSVSEINSLAKTGHQTSTSTNGAEWPPCPSSDGANTANNLSPSEVGLPASEANFLVDAKTPVMWVDHGFESETPHKSGATLLSGNTSRLSCL